MATRYFYLFLILLFLSEGCSNSPETHSTTPATPGEQFDELARYILKNKTALHEKETIEKVFVFFAQHKLHDFITNSKYNDWDHRDRILPVSDLKNHTLTLRLDSMRNATSFCYFTDLQFAGADTCHLLVWFAKKDNKFKIIAQEALFAHRLKNHQQTFFFIQQNSEKNMRHETEPLHLKQSETILYLYKNKMYRLVYPTFLYYEPTIKDCNELWTWENCLMKDSLVRIHNNGDLEFHSQYFIAMSPHKNEAAGINHNDEIPFFLLDTIHTVKFNPATGYSKQIQNSLFARANYYFNHHIADHPADIDNPLYLEFCKIFWPEIKQLSVKGNADQQKAAKYYMNSYLSHYGHEPKAFTLK